jgi:hypothetical protein
MWISSQTVQKYLRASLNSSHIVYLNPIVKSVSIWVTRRSGVADQWWLRIEHDKAANRLIARIEECRIPYLS